MGYTRQHILSDNMINLRKQQQNEWQKLLTQRTHNLFEPLTPHEQFPAYLSSFIDMPQVGQLYICGLLNDHQFTELSLESIKYHSECEQMIRENFLDELQEEQIASIMAPTIYEIQSRLSDPAFHDPIIDKYINIMEQIHTACIMQDLNHLNTKKQFLNLEDGPDTSNIFNTNDAFVLNANALETCLLIRNGCTHVPNEYNTYLNKVLNRFYADTLSCLKNVPENEFTKGTSERAKWSYELLTTFFPKNDTPLRGNNKEIMSHLLKKTKKLLSMQHTFDDDWKTFLTNWFDNFMKPYHTFLNTQDTSPKKINHHSTHPLNKNDGRDRTN